MSRPLSAGVSGRGGPQLLVADRSERVHGWRLGQMIPGRAERLLHVGRLQVLIEIVL
ncbi:MAG: hypothetical protein ACR2MP_26355 [Streptosporangiaceae bacterium]